MGKQKFDRMKKTLSMLMLVLVIVPLTTMAASAASGSGGHGHGGHGHDGGGYGGWGGYVGWGGPGFYPPAPYGMSGDSNVICGPYGCALNEPLNYLPQVLIAEAGW